MPRGPAQDSGQQKPEPNQAPGPHLGHSYPLRCSLQHHNVFLCLFDRVLFCLFSTIPYCLFLRSLLELSPDIKLMFTENGPNKFEEIFH